MKSRVSRARTALASILESGKLVKSRAEMPPPSEAMATMMARVDTLANPATNSASTADD
jgi:hypothetical protein